MGQDSLIILYPFSVLLLDIMRMDLCQICDALVAYVFTALIMLTQRSLCLFVEHSSAIFGQEPLTCSFHRRRGNSLLIYTPEFFSLMTMSPGLDVYFSLQFCRKNIPSLICSPHMSFWPCVLSVLFIFPNERNNCSLAVDVQYNWQIPLLENYEAFSNKSPLNWPLIIMTLSSA